MLQRRSDVLEMITERFLAFSLGGGVAIAGAALLFKLKGDGTLVGLAYVLAVGGAASICLAFYAVWGIRKVSSFDSLCPYCEEVNTMTSPPEDDFRCVNCNRLIPVRDGKVLAVTPALCEHCGKLNYYSAKTELLLCEECNHRVTMAGHADSGRSIPRSFIPLQEDLSPYELILVDPGHHTEDVARVLQQMLALNRAQVRQLMLDAPIQLLSGITRRKAEVLQAQLAIHDAAAEFRQLPEAVPEK